MHPWLIIFGALILGGCNPTPEINEGASTSGNANPEAPYLWTNVQFPKTLRIDSSFSTDEINGIKEMATAWKTAVLDRKTFFAWGQSVGPNSYNLAKPDGVMGIYKATTWPRDISRDALAITQIFGRRYNTGSDNEFVGIEHADIILNDDDFNFYAINSAFGQYDLKTVVLHEMGHFLGLQHVPTYDYRPDVDKDLDADDYKSSSVMYPSVNPSDVKRVPQTKDINNLVDKYSISGGGLGLSTGSNFRPNNLGSNVRIIIELRASGECIHTENGAVVKRHFVKIKKN